MSKPKRFVPRPAYPGGPRAMRAFLKENLQLPEEARLAGVDGKVRVKYSIDYTGKVVATEVLRSLGHGCDEEAERVVSLLVFDVPQQAKRKVRVHQTIDINFKVSKQKVKPMPPTTGPTYVIVPDRVAAIEGRVIAKSPAPVTYHYTVTITNK